MCRISQTKCSYCYTSRKRLAGSHFASKTPLFKYPLKWIFFLLQEKQNSKNGEIVWPELKPCLYKRRWAMNRMLVCTYEHKDIKINMGFCFLDVGELVGDASVSMPVRCLTEEIVDSAMNQRSEEREVRFFDLVPNSVYSCPHDWRMTS